MKEDIIHCLYFPLFVLEDVSARPNNGMKCCAPREQVEKIPPSQIEEGKKSFECINKKEKETLILSELHDHNGFFLLKVQLHVFLVISSAGRQTEAFVSD